MEDNGKVIIEDSFEFEKKAIKVCLYFYMGLIIIGIIALYTTNPFPENLYMLLIIIPCAFLMYFIFYKMIQQSEKARGFMISEEQIEIQIPSKPLEVLPWEDLLFIRVTKILSTVDSDGPTYKILFKYRLRPRKVYLHGEVFHQKKLRLFVRKLQEFALKKGISYSAARKYLGMIKDRKEEVDIKEDLRF